MTVKSTQASPIVIVLFSLPFAAVGVGAAAWIAFDFAAARKMQQWQETPAIILGAKLEQHADSDGGVTYEAHAEYAYEYGGRRYTARRVALGGGSDNIGTFQQKVYRQLREHELSGRPFRCFVNPANPAEAVLFRDLRWEMVAFKTIFAVAFGGVGFGLMALGLFGARKAKEEKKRAASHPGKPWLWKSEWAEGWIPSSSGRSATALAVFAVFWNVVSILPAWYAVREGFFMQGEKMALLALLFPAIGFGLIAAAAVAVARRRKYGLSVFEMASVPGVVGGQLAGVIRVPAKVQAEEGFRLALRCIQTVTTGSGKHRSTSERVLWEGEQAVARELRQADPAQTAVPVLFEIPSDCDPTDESDRIAWRLECRAKTPGLDYATTFDVPVFRAAASG